MNQGNGQHVYFTTTHVRQIGLNPRKTMLSDFIMLCQNVAIAKTLQYSEVPSYYTWNASMKSFERRKRGKRVDRYGGILKETALGRLYSAHPNQHEYFFLRMLLLNVSGRTSF